METFEKDGTSIPGADVGRQQVLDQGRTNTLGPDPASDRDRAAELRDRARSEAHVDRKAALLLEADDAERAAVKAESSATWNESEIGAKGASDALEP